MAKVSDKTADSDKIAEQKGKLLEILNDISTHDDKFEELVQLLEGIQIPGSYPDADQYHVFCQAYTIRLLQKYVVSKDEREILLALYRLLDGYENFTQIQELHLYYAEKAFGHNKHIKVWKNPDNSLSKIEMEIISKLAERLMGVIPNTSRNKGWLNLADTVVQELSKQFPDGLPEKLPLPLPSYLPPTSTPQRSRITNLPPVEELFPTAKEIILTPGEIFQLKVAVLPKEAVDAPLSYVSLDPSTVTVSMDGMLKAEEKKQKLLHNIRSTKLFRAFWGAENNQMGDIKQPKLLSKPKAV